MADPETAQHKRLVSGLLILILLGFFLRAFRIDWQSLWVDENFTVFLSAKDLVSITQITSHDVHPPLYYYLVHYWMSLTGQSEFSLRFLSLIFALPMVPLMFKLGSLWTNRRVGILAAGLIAIAPFQVYYAQEARMYSLMGLLSLLSMYALVKLADYRLSDASQAPETRRNARYWVLLVASSALLLWVHYFGFLFVFFENSVVLLTRFRNRPFLFRWFLSQLTVAVLFAPWASVMLRVYITNDEPWRRHIPLLPMMQEIMVNLSIGQSLESNILLILAAGFFLAMLVGMVALLIKKGRRSLLVILGLYVFEPILLAYLISFNKPVYGGSRYFIFIAPGFYLLVSWGLTFLRAKALPVFLLLLAYLVAGSGYALAGQYWDQTFAKDDYRGLAKLVEEKASPNDGLVVMNGLVFDYYYHGSLPVIYLPEQYPLNEAQILDDLNRFRQGKSKLWLLEWKSNVLDPDGFIKGAMEQFGTKVEEGSIRGLEYSAYTFSPNASFQPAIGHPLEASFDGKIALDGYSLSQEKVSSGKSLDLTLQLKAIQALDQDYKISILLKDAQGDSWGQVDKVPTGYSMNRWRVGEPIQSRFQLNVPLGTPPGEYSLSMVVYRASDLEPLPAVDSKQSPVGTVLRLGSIQVERGALPYDASAVSPSHSVGQDLAPEIRLLGYDVSAAEVDQGGALTVALYWQAMDKPADDYSVSLRLVDDKGNSIQELTEKPDHGQYSTLRWQAGEIVRDVHVLQVGGAAPSGTSRLLVSLGAGGAQPAELSSVLIKEKPHSFTVPSIQNPMDLDLGGKVGFLGYALDGSTVHPGGNIGLTLYWQARSGGLDNYAIFTHLLDGQNQIWAQHDGEPAGGAQPTSGWVEGEVVTDPHQLIVKADAPPGEYVIEIGMYDPSSGARLKLPNGEDRILLGKVEVSASP